MAFIELTSKSGDKVLIDHKSIQAVVEEGPEECTIYPKENTDVRSFTVLNSFINVRNKLQEVE